MLVDAEGQLRWASASDQTAQAVEDGQERLAQGPCAVAFSQRPPAAIRDIRVEPEWAEFTQVLLGEGICAALSVPVELDGGGHRHPGHLRRLADVAKDVTAGQPLPSSSRDLARARAEQARERENGSERGN
jgi:hypothetical protein